MRLANVLSWCNTIRWSDADPYTRKQSSLSHRSRSPSTIGTVCHDTDLRLPASMNGPVSYFGRRVGQPDGSSKAQCGKPPTGAAFSGRKVLGQTYFLSPMASFRPESTRSIQRHVSQDRHGLLPRGSHEAGNMAFIFPRCSAN